MEIINRKSSLIFMLVLQFITFSFILLDIPIARQVIGFIYLTFIPGYIFLKIIKANNFDFWETVLLSLGLSVAFLMFLGLSINELGPLIGISKPLSILPLMLIVNTFVLLMVFLNYFASKGDFGKAAVKGLKLSPLVIPFILLPLVSVTGAVLVNGFENNFLLLIMILIIAVLVPLSVLSKRLLHPKFYPLALLMVSLALLFHASLISNYIYGNDIHAEFNLFHLTNKNSNWDSKSLYTDPELTKLNSMLSITVLPTVYSTFLNMDETWILKIVYPLIFSFISLGLYKLYNAKVKDKVAFLSAFFFIANFTFFTEILGLARQMVAEIFYVLLFFVLLNEKMKPVVKTIFFIIFSGALIVSHYALSYLFIFFIFFTWLFMYFAKRKPKNVTLGLIVFFLSLSFLWYIYVSRSEAFNAIVTIWGNVSSNFFRDLFNPTSRGQDVMMGLGVASSPTFWHSIGRIFAYATEFLIVVGFISLVIKEKNKIFEQEYPLLLTFNMAMIIFSIIVPNFSPSLRMTRLYHLLLISLAPLFILGVEALSSFLFAYTGKHFGFLSKLGRQKTELCALALVLVVLVPFFLFQTEFVYEATGDFSTSIPLSRYRIGLVAYFDLGFFDEKDVFGAKWLSSNLNVDNTTVYGDRSSKFQVLTSYGMINDPYKRIELLSNDTAIAKGTIYLTQTNTVYGVIRGKYRVFNITDITPILNGMNKIYSNGGSEIYQNSTKQWTSIEGL